MSVSPKLAGLAALIFLGCVLYFTPRLFRRTKGSVWLLGRKLFRNPMRPLRSPGFYATLSSDEDLALRRAMESSDAAPQVQWAARCLVGGLRKGGDIPPLVVNRFAKLVAEGESGEAEIYLLTRRGRGFEAHKLPLEGKEVAVERRFFSEDVVIYSTDEKGKLGLRFHAGERRLAEKVADELLRVRSGVALLDGDQGALQEEGITDPDIEAANVLESEQDSEKAEVVAEAKG